MTPADAGAEPDSALARRRREAIVGAATEIIASEGLHRLSLGRIERKVAMSRGQLTYYFRTKEAILLAVFDRMLARMIAEAMAQAEPFNSPPGQAWAKLRQGLGRTLGGSLGPDHTSLHPLVHTFMAQVSHRADYRERLAGANAAWRDHLRGDFAESMPPSRVGPRAMAPIVMALFMGLTDQLAVDPDAFDRQEVLGACVELLAPWFRTRPPEKSPTKTKTARPPRRPPDE